LEKHKQPDIGAVGFIDEYKVQIIDQQFKREDGGEKRRAPAAQEEYRNKSYCGRDRENFEAIK